MRAPSDQREGGTPGPANSLSGPAPGASIVRSRLFIKYLALFVAVVSLALIANGIFDVFFSYKEQKASLVRIQREQAEAAAGKIGQFISEIESQVGWTTQLPWSAGTLEQRRFDALRLLRQVPAITELAEIDSTGHEQLRVSRLAMEVVGSGNDVSKEPAFTEAVAHKVYYGPVYFRRESEPYMTLSLAGTRRDTGVSIAQVNLKLIWDVLSKIKFSGHGRAYVVDAAGRLIAHPDISLVLRNTDMSQLAQVQSARAAVTGNTAEQVQEATDIEGHKVLTASAAVAPLGWHVFVETPIEEAYAPLYAAIERTALVLLAALALAFAAGMFLARRMVVPIQALRAGAARLGSGDLGQRIAIKTGDEVEALADQFNDMAGRLQESYADLEHKVEVRTRELSESLEQQTATSEVLQVISSSPGELDIVFEAMLKNAVRMCNAAFGNIYRWDGEVLSLLATHKTPPAFAEARRRSPHRPGSETPLGRMIASKAVIHIADTVTDPSYAEQRDPAAATAVEIGGVRAALLVPMLSENELIGSFTVYRQEPRPFTEKQIELVKNFAAQAVIAIENARLLAELREALEQQTATAEVLQVISGSPGDLQPVFEAMLENATRLCEAPFGTLLLRDGEVLRIAAGHVPPASSAIFEPGSELVVADNPGHPLVRVLSTKDIYHISDLRTEPSYIAGNPRVVAFVEKVGARTALCVPMMKDDECVGAFVTCRQEVRPFTDKQIALVENFAAQAVIAIENARLLTELRQSLEQQTATADVLRVISSSPSDLTPVFDAMLANAARLCEAQFGNLLLCEDDAFRVGAQHRIPTAFAEHFQRGTVFHPGPLAPVSRAAATGDFVHIVDLTADAAYQAGDPPVVAVADLGGARSMLVVPMLKEGDTIGALSIFRQEVRPFTDKQIELVKNFAAQAVIAIENARLLTELRQSLEQQTATSEVLGVISRSKFELQPILQSVVDTAARLCHADAAVIFRLEEDGLYRFAAGYSLEPAYIEIERRTPIAPGSGTIVGRAAMSRQVARINDAWTDPLYEKKEQAKIGPGARSMMGVPLMRDGEAIGVIGLARSRIEPFAERDVDLVTTFADQAVIAIENVRLFEAEQQRRRELTESLEQQTATSDVLQVISSSPGDLDPVFDAMLENAVRICDATFGGIYRIENDTVRLVATHKDVPAAYARARRFEPFRPSPKHYFGRMMATRTVLHITDTAAEPGYLERRPEYVAAVDLGDVRTFMAVPMLKENEPIGAFLLARQEIRPFTDKQIALVTSFANQAVIAIENTRLLTELRQRTDELGRSVGELRALGEVSQAVNSTLELETVLSTIVSKAVQLSNTEAGAIYVLDERDREFHLRATYGMDQELIDALSQRHIGFDESNVTLALANREPIQVADLRDDPPSELNDLILRAGYRARLMAPLFRGADIVGLLVVRRRTPGAFPQNTVDLIKTFAAQSVLAIQNARLFQEIDEKSRELEVAGQHKSQFLANMSHELRTPLNAIIGYSEILQEEAADADQNEIVPDLKKIESAGRHLLGLINDILDLSKVEAGRMEVFLEDVELVPLLEEVRALIGPLAEKNGNVLDLKLAEDIGTIHTDRTKLKQSLLNVLSNGSKFTENGRLTLVAERFADNTGRPMVRFAISDTGIGMTEEQLGRLFQAFSQADASTTKKYGGTGLGLAISRQFCQLLGGDITVTSRPGEGSTFTIILPTRSDGPAQVKPADAPRIAAEVNGVATVLIVDDDPAARELLTASLKSTGYRLVHASSGTEALALARTVRPDAITLDVMMPKPDGWDVLTALKADADLYDIPVIIVTMAPDRGIGLSLGAVDVLTKPVDRARLTALIHRLVRRDGPVLVVEDDADTREMMRHTIAKMGLAVAEAANGRRALGWLGEHAPPAMILLDLMMPEMDGFEFLDALSARTEWHEIPIVVVTAKQLSTAERERLLLQARKVIEKAKATRVDIAAAIATAVRRRSGRAAVVANADK